MKPFFSYIQRNRDEILTKHGDAFSFCSLLLTNLDGSMLPDEIRVSLDNAEADDKDYAIASAYAVLIGKEQRKTLSAYFTPPILARAVIEASAPFLDEMEHPVVLDPACGGGSFLTPIARYLVTKKCREGLSWKEACKSTLKDIQGIEIDAGLAALSQTLLRRMLAREYGFVRRGALGVVRRGDALCEVLPRKFDLVIGNPPYGKIRDKVDKSILEAAGLANLGGHTNLYSLFLLRGLDWVKPGGGLIFVLPTSFVAGPYFAGLRQEVLRRAEVIRIDLHEQRENLFLGAVQDVCLLTLKKRNAAGSENDDLGHSYELGFIDASGARSRGGTGAAKAGGEPWTLPVANQVRFFSQRRNEAEAAHEKSFVLSDYGYRVRVGKVVPTRERDRLHTSRKKGDLPLVWASSIRPDGSFDFNASRRLGNAPWYSPPTQEIGYTTTKPAVVVQRTSNRDQSRRLNAAPVPKRFRNEHRDGFVAENHVIVLEATTNRPLVSPSKLVDILNSGVVNERFSAVSGSFSVSAKLLQRMALPSPRLIKDLNREAFEHCLRRLFDGLGEVLAPIDLSDAARDPEDALHKPRDVESSLPVDQNTRLKRRAVA